MDVLIDGSKLIAMRKEKAWSQQHLADVSGLSIKTVQRVEKNSKASYESVKALSSAFDVKPDKLQLAEIPTPTIGSVPISAAHSRSKFPNVGLLFAVIACLSVGTLSFVASQGSADTIEQKAKTSLQHKTKDVVFMADAITQAPDGRVIYKGNVNLSLPSSLMHSIEAEQITIKPNGSNVFTGEVSLELSDIQIHSAQVAIETKNDVLDVRADELEVIYF